MMLLKYVPFMDLYIVVLLENSLVKRIKGETGEHRFIWKWLLKCFASCNTEGSINHHFCIIIIYYYFFDPVLLLLLLLLLSVKFTLILLVACFHFVNFVFIAVSYVEPLLLVC